MTAEQLAALLAHLARAVRQAQAAGQDDFALAPPPEEHAAEIHHRPEEPTR